MSLHQPAPRGVVGLDCEQRRLLVAVLESVWAAIDEATPPRQIHRRRDAAGDGDELGLSRLPRGRRPQQRLRVGMAGAREDALDRTLLENPADRKSTRLNSSHQITS